MNPLVLSLLLLFANDTGVEFERPAVWPVRIEIAAEDLESLRTKPRVPVPAKVRIRDKPPVNASVKLKGHGSFQPIDQKPSLTIVFDRLPSAHRPFGLEKFHLNNSIEDASYLKERIGSEIFRDAGIAAPRVGHARVLLNDRELGLYVLKEGFTKDFLKSNFGEATGKLYDTDQGHDVNQEMELDIGQPDHDRELQELAAAVVDPNDNRRLERLDAILDLDRFLTFLAMEVLICHWDGYGLSQNNYRIYVRETGKVEFLPAGMDQIFSKPDLPWNLPMSGLVARSILSTQLGRERYAVTFRNLHEGFDDQRYSNRVTELLSNLRPFLSRVEFQTVSKEAAELAARISTRKANLRQQLNAPPVPEITFLGGSAAVSNWRPFDEPPDGRMVEEERSMRIIAGEKTSASWRAKVRLQPGLYAFSTTVATRGVISMPFGNRHGATLRVVGKDAQSDSLLGTSRKNLHCQFELTQEEVVVLACELRASAGEVAFDKVPTLEIVVKK